MLPNPAKQLKGNSDSILKPRENERKINGTSE